MARHASETGRWRSRLGNSCLCSADADAAIETDGASLDRTIFRLDQELPGKFVRPRRTGIAAGTTEDRSFDVISRGGTFALQCAKHLVAVLVGPDAAADKACFAIHQRDDVRAETDAWAPFAGEQHRSAKINDRAFARIAERNRAATARCIPRSGELVNFIRDR